MDINKVRFLVISMFEPENSHGSRNLQQRAESSSSELATDYLESFE